MSTLLPATAVIKTESGVESLHDDTELTDFELKGDDGSVRAHKLVLAAASPVLRRMTSGNWREAGGVLAIEGMSRATLQDFKNYIYLRQLPETGLEDLVLLGSKFMMPDLEEAASAKAVEDLTAEKACDLLDYAMKNKVVRLQVKILQCVQNKTVEVDQMEKYLSLVSSFDYMSSI